MRRLVIAEGKDQDAQRIYSSLIDVPLSVFGLRDALALTGPLSVDALIEHRPEFLEVGKAAMARVLLSKERHDALFDQKEGDIEGDWMGLLFRYMAGPLEDFGRNAVSFVTFNYDRLIELFYDFDKAGE